jgi:hypothetical protein
MMMSMGVAAARLGHGQRGCCLRRSFFTDSFAGFAPVSLGDRLAVQNTTVKNIYVECYVGIIRGRNP